MKSGRSREVLPVVEEQLAVTKQPKTVGRARVRTRAVTHAQDVAWTEAHEELTVERVPVDRLVERTPELRVEGSTTIIPVVEEIVVVEKRLLLREEIRVTKRRVVKHRHARVPLRKQIVDVEQELAGSERTGRRTA